MEILHAYAAMDPMVTQCWMGRTLSEISVQSSPLFSKRIRIECGPMALPDSVCGTETTSTWSLTTPARTKGTQLSRFCLGTRTDTPILTSDSSTVTEKPSKPTNGTPTTAFVTLMRM